MNESDQEQTQPIRVLPVTAPHPPRRRWVGVAIAAGVAVVLVAAAVVMVVRDSSRRAAVEDAEARQAEIHTAYGGGAGTAGNAGTPTDRPVDAAGVQTLFDDFSAALGEKRTEAVDHLVDIERMQGELMRQPGLPRLTDNDRRAVRTGLRRTITTILGGGGAMSAWARTDVRMIRPLSGDEALVYARHRDPSGASLHMRWWLRRADGRWRVYDFEDLDSGFRVTGLMGTMLAAAQKNPQLVGQAKAVQQAVVKAVHGDYDGADQQLKSLRLGNAMPTLPPAVEALRALAQSLVHMSRAEWDAALAELDKGEAANPQMIGAHLMRAIVYNAKGEPEPALAACEKAVSLMGYLSVDVAEQKGKALAALDRPAEAAVAFAAGLDDDAASAGCLVGLAQALPPERQAEVGERFARTDMGHELFRTVANEIDRPDWKVALASLVDAYERKYGRTLDGDYMRGLLLFIDEQYEASAGMFRAHLGTNDPFYAQGVHNSFLQAMWRAGRAVEAYRLVRDPQAAFDVMAKDMHGASAGSQLNDLIAEHRRARPDDPSTYSYEAWLAADENRYEAADVALAKAIERATTDEQRDRFLRRRVLAQCAMGNGLRAYETLRPSVEGFDQIASFYVARDDAAGLAALVEAHARRVPDDRLLGHWRAELKFHQKQYEPVVASLSGDPTGWREDDDRAYARGRDRLMRSLIRLGRTEQAVEVARRKDADEDWVDPWYLAIAEGCAGNAAETIRAMEEATADEMYELSEFYDDEDLGPVLASSEKLASVRERFPRPTTQPTAQPTTRAVE